MSAKDAISVFPDLPGIVEAMAIGLPIPG